MAQLIDQHMTARLKFFFRQQYEFYDRGELVLAAAQAFPDFFRANLDNPAVLDEVDQIAATFYPDDDSYLGEPD